MLNKIRMWVARKMRWRVEEVPKKKYKLKILYLPTLRLWWLGIKWKYFTNPVIKKIVHLIAKKEFESVLPPMTNLHQSSLNVDDPEAWARWYGYTSNRDKSLRNEEYDNER